MRKFASKGAWVVLIVYTLTFILVGVVVMHSQTLPEGAVTQESVFAEIGRLTLTVRFLNEKILQLEKQNKDLQERLNKYEHPPLKESK
jgi:hypothetical protein